MFEIPEQELVEISNVNPIRYARALEQMTQTKLAKDLMLSRSFVIRVEQSVYRTPGEELTNWAGRVLNIAPREVQERYELHQHIKRELALLDIPSITPISAPVAAQDQNKNFSSDGVTTRIFCYEVFALWRMNYWDSANDFCVQMCVHPDSVKKYEAGDMLHMPDQLESVLREINMLGNLDHSKRWYYV